MLRNKHHRGTRQLEAAIAYFLPLLRQVAAKVKLVQAECQTQAQARWGPQILDV